MESEHIALGALVAGFVLDRILGDPAWFPHPVVGFGKAISWFEKILNKGSYRFIKGAFMTILLIGATYAGAWYCLARLQPIYPAISVVLSTVIVFSCLSALTLRKEVEMVFEALQHSLDNGRIQLARIVGRDTSKLSTKQIRIAALETLSENLSDGVIAPLFWFALLGAPGMLAYKMINTLDSMIGYKNERYALFGKMAARLDDIANLIPARLTALLMLVVSGNLSKAGFVLKYGNKHASPNSGYPEAALAGILGCRFGGPNRYAGKIVPKPYIGTVDRIPDGKDLKLSVSINRRCEVCMLLIVSIVIFTPVLINYIL